VAENQKHTHEVILPAGSSNMKKICDKERIFIQMTKYIGCHVAPMKSSYRHELLSTQEDSFGMTVCDFYHTGNSPVIKTENFVNSVF